ncbi:MAG: prolyl oligopeptidase family serine peptidase [Pyrinomonadaceae bacterium]
MHPRMNPAPQGKLNYPTPRKGDQVDDYFGTKVADPYRWLEDPDSAETRAWVEAENQVTFSYLDQIPERATIKERLTKLWNYERYSVPFKEGGRYFYYKNDGLQNQSVLYTTDTLAGTPRVLLDPNTLSADGTIALAGSALSWDGKMMAYGLSASGSDWEEWKVRDVTTGKDTTDHLKWVKFSGASWSHDNKGFYYSRYDEPNEKTALEDANYNQKLFYHVLGTPQSEDKLIYQRPDHKDWGFGGEVTEDGHFLVISVWQGTENNNRLYYQDLQTPNAPVVELLNDFDAQYTFLDNDGPILWLQTTLDAPRGRVIAIDTRKPERANWKEVIPQAPESLQGVATVGGHFLTTYLKDAYSQVKVFTFEGKLVREVQLPGIGDVGGFGGKRNDNETFYSFTSFTAPNTIYRYDVATGKSEIFRQPKVDFNPSGYEVKQVKYKSKDGTMVPMFIVHKKGLKLDGTNPTILYGYGGFSISLTPFFSVGNLVWMEMGGVYAMPNLRGGGEYGEEWHLAGTKAKKQNVFDDLIGAAEWLIANKYTSTPKLAISGGSNGGLLIGACLNQRPDLFGAGLPAVGVMDMLRFHKFTIGWGWVSDYGSAAVAEEFPALFAYSPLHNIKPGTKYPATMVTTADHDDRVVPAHSFKYTATLQAAQGGTAPILIRIETKAGHGGGKPTTKIIEEKADEFGFLVRELKMKPVWPKN